MSDNPWIKFYPSDWLAGTRGLTAAETGVYITLICLMYESEGAVRNDAKYLATQCRLPAGRLQPILDKLIAWDKITVNKDGLLTNNRALEEIGARLQKQVLAKQSAKTRWQKKPKENNEPTKRTHSKRNANQNQNKKSDFSDCFKDIRGDIRLSSGSDEAAAWLTWFRANGRQCPNPLNGFFYFNSKHPPTSEAA